MFAFIKKKVYKIFSLKYSVFSSLNTLHWKRWGYFKLFRVFRRRNKVKNKKKKKKSKDLKFSQKKEKNLFATSVMNREGHNLHQMSLKFNIKKHLPAIRIIKCSERFLWEAVESPWKVTCPSNMVIADLSISQQQFLAHFSNFSSPLFPNPLCLNLVSLHTSTTVNFRTLLLPPNKYIME